MTRFNLKSGCPLPSLMQGEGRSRKFMKSASRTKLRLFLGMTLFILTAIWAWGIL